MYISVEWSTISKKDLCNGFNYPSGEGQLLECERN